MTLRERLEDLIGGGRLTEWGTVGKWLFAMAFVAGIVVIFAMGFWAVSEFIQ